MKGTAWIMKRIVKDNWEIFLIMIIAVLSRFILIGYYPGGVHADEAFSGYEAWSMLNYGYDSWGYHNPVYLTVWGGGMSVLESLLMIPFVAVGGLNTWMVRMPNMIMGILSVYVFYKLLSKVSTKNIACLGGFLLAISPWHIMTSRYGMDANLSPALILLGIYFTVLGIEKEKYLILAAMFWGLSLYAYVVNWIFVPIMLIGIVVYCMRMKKLRFSRYTVMSVIVLFLEALPLLLFVAVNFDLLPEIRTSFISIPKMAGFRSDELAFSGMFGKIIKFARILVTQNDYCIWNSIKWFGIYYLYSLPFIVVGVYVIAKQIFVSLKNHSFNYCVLLLWWLVCGSFMGLIQEAGINRINCLCLALFILLAVGVAKCADIWKNYFRNAIITVYIVSFVIFIGYYFTAYQPDISQRQMAGAGAALEYAMQISSDYGDGYIYVTGSLRHSQVLFYTKYPTDKYINEVKWENYPAKQLIAESFGTFRWGDDNDRDDVHIITTQEVEDYMDNYSITVFGTCAVAVPNS
jgi:4-amino-4-deoxy-L-arabinose transferase-like glycosyltransferase